VENGFGELYARNIGIILIPKLRHFNRESCMCFHTEKTFFKKFFAFFLGFEEVFEWWENAHKEIK
jgi:hypothetical protein